MPIPPAPQPRDPRIDTLRGVAILLVLLHHFSNTWSLPASALGEALTPDLVGRVTRNGNYGVTMFFVLSGHLITADLLRRGAPGRIDLAGFYRRRAARILPSLLLMVGTVSALAAAGVPDFVPVGVPLWLADLSVLTFWHNVLMAARGWFSYPLNILWSLSVEEVFYAGFPLLCRALRAPRLVALACVAVALIGPLWRAAHADDEMLSFYAYPACFDAIAIGCLTALCPVRPPVAARLAALAALIATYVSAWIADAITVGPTLIALATATLVIGPRATVPHRETALRRAGRRSYELYLFHVILLGLARALVPPRSLGPWATLAALALYLTASSVVAGLIGRYFADPIRRLAAPGLSPAPPRTAPAQAPAA